MANGVTEMWLHYPDGRRVNACQSDGPLTVIVRGDWVTVPAGETRHLVCCEGDWRVATVDDVLAWNPSGVFPAEEGEAGV